MQEGFDQAYASSVDPSRHLGQLRGRATALLSFIRTINTGDSSVGEVTKVQSDVKSLLSDLNGLKKDDVLPIDEEALAHEREAHEGGGGGNGGMSVSPSFKKKMDGNVKTVRDFEAELNQAMEGLKMVSAELAVLGSKR